MGKRGNSKKRCACASPSGAVNRHRNAMEDVLYASKASLENLVLQFTRERIEGWTSNIDYDKALPILALIRKGKKQSIVGSASLRFHSADALKHACGTAMINHLLVIARKKGLKKVYLRVNIENARAIHVHEKCGFKIEARLRMERYQNGKFGDEYRMAIFL